MMKDALALVPDSYYAWLSLALFLVSFAGIMIWAFRKGAKKVYDHMSTLPLDHSKGESL